MEQSKLDQFKRHLVGEFEEEPEEMAIKLEKEDLKSLMARAMAKAMVASQGGVEHLGAGRRMGQRGNHPTPKDSRILGRRPRNVVYSPREKVSHQEDHLR